MEPYREPLPEQKQEPVPLTISPDRYEHLLRCEKVLDAVEDEELIWIEPPAITGRRYWQVAFGIYDHQEGAGYTFKEAVENAKDWLPIAAIPEDLPEEEEPSISPQFSNGFFWGMLFMASGLVMYLYLFG